jgi:hypothetical protein
MPSAQNVVITDGTTPITLKPREVGDQVVFTNDANTFIERNKLVTSNRLARANMPQKTRMSLKEPVVGTVDGEEKVIRTQTGTIELLSDPNSSSAERSKLWEHMESLFTNSALKAQFVEGEQFFG